MSKVKTDIYERISRMPVSLGKILNPGCEIKIFINDIKYECIISDKPCVYVIYTDNGNFMIPLLLSKKLIKGEMYIIKARYDHSSPLNRRYNVCSYCGGTRCKNCDNTGYEPSILYEPFTL